jgi:hypothetical protein
MFLHTLDLDYRHDSVDTENWIETTVQYDRFPTGESGLYIYFLLCFYIQLNLKRF